MRKFLLGVPRAIRSTTDIPGWWQKERAIVKKAASGLSKNFKDPEFRAATKIMKYKKQRYFG